MGDRLQLTLRGLCHKTQWKYAVFWKLKHRARMMLTWEDAYYDNRGVSDPSNSRGASVFSNDVHTRFQDGSCMGDPLGLAVAKMSYLVYSLGEGIVGQVAFTRKHQWIFADKPASCSLSSYECSDGWQAQFLAGIKTIAIIAVVPHGVVQLGSLTTVEEDLKLVSHVKDVFGLLQNSSAFLPDSMHYSLRNILNPPEMLVKSSRLDVSNDYSRRDQVASNPEVWSHLFPSQEVIPLLDVHERKVASVAGHVAAGSPTLGDCGVELLNPGPGNLSSEFQKLLKVNKIGIKKPSEENARECREMHVCGHHSLSLSSHKFHLDNTSFNEVEPSVDMCRVGHSCLPPVNGFPQHRFKSDQIFWLQDELLNLRKPLDMQLQGNSEKKRESQAKVGCTESTDTGQAPLKFSSGCELQEALGSAFKNEGDDHVWSESGMIEIDGLSEQYDGVLGSLATPSCRSEHLLEAVVASASLGASSSKSEKSLCKSSVSSLTTVSTVEAPNHIKRSGSGTGGQVQTSLIAAENTHHYMTSVGGPTELFVVRSLDSSVSMTPSMCSGLSETQMEPAKANRKRARPGESCRPRPRDRQLIQDRVKELREIVPNGSKCSIDALLERTIKHMTFLQNVTSHADKLKRCVESKLRDKESYLLGTWKNERNASWALEVGSQSSACPIVVENLNSNGQMLVEMLCEDCSYFLEIAEVIRSLGLTILKGETETRADKTWACFLVEGMENGGLQRMDILWSLVHLLQPKALI